eukprot:gb/GFBE01069513.1/.p1 GENE.gb/GFBE01069513.1/~~gb/GFBE01069513.1/.p1  ORF type:complete len:170 (+),score=33.05 gb/GFBE01069513.1/:1-510(+)
MSKRSSRAGRGRELTGLLTSLLLAACLLSLASAALCSPALQAFLTPRGGSPLLCGSSVNLRASLPRARGGSVVCQATDALPSDGVASIITPIAWVASLALIGLNLFSSDGAVATSRDAGAEWAKNFGNANAADAAESTESEVPAGEVESVDRAAPPKTVEEKAKPTKKG